MSEIRLEEAYDGVCTVTVGPNLVVTDLTREEAERLVGRYRSAGAD